MNSRLLSRIWLSLLLLFAQHVAFADGLAHGPHRLKSVVEYRGGGESIASAATLTLTDLANPIQLQAQPSLDTSDYGMASHVDLLVDDLDDAILPPFALATIGARSTFGLHALSSQRVLSYFPHYSSRAPPLA